MLNKPNKFWVLLAMAALSSPACTVAPDDDDPTGGGSVDDDDDAGAADDDTSDDDVGDDDSSDDDSSDDDDYFFFDGGAPDAGEPAVDTDAGAPDGGTPWGGDAAALVEVPSLIGLTEAEARAALEELGLELGTITDEEADGGAAGTITGQAIAAGEEVEAGTAVDVVMIPAWDAERISDELDIPDYPAEDEVDETVGGVDDDGDGIRDDAERDLAVKYWPDRQLIDIINELIRDDQLMITNPGDADIVTDALERKKLALGCLEIHLDGDLLRALEVTGDIAAHVLDTPDRLAAARAVDSSLGGQVITLPTQPEVEQFCQGLFTPELAVDAAEAAAQNTSACLVEPKTIVTYSNSILQRHDKAIINGMALRQMVVTNGAADENFVYKLAFNDSDAIYAAAGGSDDYGDFDDFGTFVGSGTAEQVAGFNHYQSGAAGIPTWIKASLEGSDAFANPSVLTAESDIGGHAAAISADGSVGNRVFMVGHGLGALSANAAYDRAVESLPGLSASVRVLGVGTPADGVAGDTGNSRYVTLETDLVVAETMANDIATALAANATNADAGEASGHEFLQSYARGDGAGPALQALIDAAIADVEAPEAIATDGIITVTLTWGDEPDVDLHAFEPNGAHVYYAAKTGMSGELDVDDVSSFGPEHYTVSCASVEEGTYQIGLNYFSGSAPETATVNVEAGGQSRTFTVELDQSRGGSGDQTPIPVADIVVTAGEAAGTFVFQIVAQ